MRIRRTTAGDVARHVAALPWLLVDGWRDGGVALLAEDGDRLLGAALAVPNRVHPLRDVLQIEVLPDHRRRGVGTGLIQALRDRGHGPFGAQAELGSGMQAFLGSLGAVRYQLCTPQTVDTGRADVRAWCVEHDGGDTVPGRDVPRAALVDYFTEQYRWQHASWAPTVEVEALRGLVGEPFADDTDLDLSRFVVRDGAVTAGCAVYADHLTPTSAIGCAEAADPARRGARAEVASCMAAALIALDGRSMEFDGHVTDPHFHPLLATIPGVTGPAIELVEVP